MRMVGFAVSFLQRTLGYTASWARTSRPTAITSLPYARTCGCWRAADERVVELATRDGRILLTEDDARAMCRSILSCACVASSLREMVKAPGLSWPPQAGCLFPSSRKDDLSVMCVKRSAVVRP